MVKLYINLALICIFLALYGYSDYLILIRNIIPIIQFLVTILLLFYCIVGMLRKQKIKKIDLLAIIFISYSFMTFFWDSSKIIYDLMINMFFMCSTFIIYYVIRNYGDHYSDVIIFSIFRWSQLIDLILVIIQIFLFKINSDFANGIFGSVYYHNGVQGLFCICCSILALYYYTKKKRTIIQTIITVSVSILICAISEIKSYFFILLMVVALYLILESKTYINKIKKSINHIFLIWGLGIALVIAYEIQNYLYTQNIVVFQNIKSFKRYLGYSSGPRSKGRISDIVNFFKENNLSIIFFGRGFSSGKEFSVYGLGNLLNAIGIIGALIFIFFIMMNCYYAKKLGKIERNFALIYSSVIAMAMVVWAGIFGNIVSFFSLYIYAILLRPATENSHTLFKYSKQV